MICAHCGRVIERDHGSWVHANGWRLCDPRACPLTFAAPHPACLPDPVHHGDIFSRIEASQEGES